MREILFRGKDIDNGIFVTGYLIGNETCKKYITLVGSHCKEVIPETVGQYTGLTDKNGRRIFEGDILKAPNWDCYGTVVYSVPECRFEIRMENGYWVSMHEFASDIEVIGNIYDNPELLKGE